MKYIIMCINLKLSFGLTEISWIMVLWTLKPNGAQVRHCTARRTLEYALTLCQHIYVVKHFVDSRSRLVNRTHNGASFTSQVVQ